MRVFYSNVKNQVGITSISKLYENESFVTNSYNKFVDIFVYAYQPDNSQTETSSNTETAIDIHIHVATAAINRQWLN